MTTPSTSPSPIDGLVHDGKITVTLGGESFKGIRCGVVDGKEVARGEVDWAKDTEGAVAQVTTCFEKMMSIIRKSNGKTSHLIMISLTECPKELKLDS